MKAGLSEREAVGDPKRRVGTVTRGMGMVHRERVGIFRKQRAPSFSVKYSERLTH